MADGFFDLSDHHALVTAAVTPLAHTLAVALAEAGADVSVFTQTDSSEEERGAVQTLEACLKLGRRGGIARLDLTDPAGVDAAVESLEREVAPLDVLVNAAHRAHIAPLLESSLADWERELKRNATAAFVPTQAVGRRMLDRGRGCVINVASLLGERGAPNAAVFGAAQGALLGFTRSLGLEWVRAGVRVNALCVGFFEELAGPQADAEHREAIERSIPVGRYGRLDDVAGAIVYLASDEAAFVNAELLLVDGGLATHA